MLPATNQQRFLKAASILTAAYLAAVFFGLPLVFSDYYFNITETKQVFFLISGGVYLLALLLTRIAFPPDSGGKAHRSYPHAAALALCAFAVVSTVGGLLSRYPGEAFWGENNRYQGLVTYFTYALVVLALSMQKVELRWPERALVLAAALAGLLGLLNHFGADPSGFFENLREADRGRFLSTLGNADFYGSYLVMAFCVAFSWFLRANSLRSRILSALALAAVSFGALVSGSDASALGLFTAAFAFPLLLFSDPAAMRRYPLGWGLFLLCAFIFGKLSPLLPSATYLSAFSVFFSRAAVSLPLAAVSLLLWFALRPVRPEKLPAQRRVYIICLLAAAFLCVAALALLNTVWRGVPLGDLSRYLRFSGSWGTDRGKIWAFAVRFYKSLPFVQKLFGAGPGALFHADKAQKLFSDAFLDTAHNEYLQYLVTNGALGLLCYLAALAFAVRAGFRRSAASPAFRGFTVALIAYAAQALVNIAQPASTPLFFVLLGVLVSRIPETPDDLTA
jgi:hypothetical protein